MIAEKTIDSFIVAIQNRNAEALSTLFSEDVIFENVPYESVVKGKSLVQEQFADFFKKVNNIHWEIERKIINDNLVIIERKNHLDFSGKKVTVPMISVIELLDDKITLFRDYFDAQTVAKQLE